GNVRIHLHPRDRRSDGTTRPCQGRNGSGSGDRLRIETYRAYRRTHVRDILARSPARTSEQQTRRPHGRYELKFERQPPAAWIPSWAVQNRHALQIKRSIDRFLALYDSIRRRTSSDFRLRG